MNRLSPRQRAVFSLRHFDDLSLEEIAGILELDTGTVKAHMFRAVTKLRGEVELLAPGSLPNDGKVVDDTRKYG